MQIQINTANAIDGQTLHIDQIEDHVESRLARFQERLTRVEIHLGDEAGSRDGRGDKRCVIEVRAAGMEPISVTDQADTIDAAIDSALSKTSTALERAYGRTTTRKGH